MGARPHVEDVATVFCHLVRLYRLVENPLASTCPGRSNPVIPHTHPFRLKYQSGAIPDNTMAHTARG
ncbi:MAG: hypothetical protein WBO24_11645, partial [Nitrospirales bacterium]